MQNCNLKKWRNRGVLRTIWEVRAPSMDRLTLGPQRPMRPPSWSLEGGWFRSYRWPIEIRDSTCALQTIDTLNFQSFSKNRGTASQKLINGKMNIFDFEGDCEYSVKISVKIYYIFGISEVILKKWTDKNKFQQKPNLSRPI